jgi:hypothetical protein
MKVASRLARLERHAKAQGLFECPECRRRLRCEIPVRRTEVLGGEPMPEPDHCPKCGVEWPRVVMGIVGPTPGELAYVVLSPLFYDPVFPGSRGVA